VTPAPEKVERWLDGVYSVSVKPFSDLLTSAVSFDAYFGRGGERFRLHTDLRSFYLYCESCGDAARDVLKAVAKALGIEKPKWYGDSLELPADVGWPTFLKLWHKYNASSPAE